ncbi:alpha/beta hydrolase [Sinorhizobium sp. 8-89]|uniref:alpha/beta hydrolase n=1 Tax=Sinorhizobium sp. 8-89 TaxID=3049089 RepID=UPI00386703E6
MKRISVRAPKRSCPSSIGSIRMTNGPWLPTDACGPPARDVISIAGVENQGSRNGTQQHAAAAIAQVVRYSGAQATPMLFTWASRARMLDYNCGKDTVRFEGSCRSSRATRAAHWRAVTALCRERLSAARDSTLVLLISRSLFSVALSVRLCNLLMRGHIFKHFPCSPLPS